MNQVPVNCGERQGDKCNQCICLFDYARYIICLGFDMLTLLCLCRSSLRVLEDINCT